MADILPVSHKFRYELDELLTKRRKKEITEEEFSVQRDALFTQETKSHESLGPVLIAKELEAVEAGAVASVNKRFQKEAQEESERQARERYAKEAERKRIEQEEEAKQDAIRLENQKKIEERERFRESVSTYISRLDNEANNAQKWLNWLQIIVIVITTATASMAGFEGVPRAAVVVSGFVAAALGGILSYLQLQEKIYSSKKALADLRLECQMYDHCINEYEDRHANSEEAYLVFSKKVTEIQARQMLHDVELLNPNQEERDLEAREKTKYRQKKKEEGRQVVEKGQIDAGTKEETAKSEP
jgi:ABC-type multidrug transport system fused ATPase/permease subunit